MKYYFECLNIEKEPRNQNIWLQKMPPEPTLNNQVGSLQARSLTGYQIKAKFENTPQNITYTDHQLYSNGKHPGDVILTTLLKCSSKYLISAFGHY